MDIGIVSLFPEMFDALRYGVIGKAVKNNLINIQFWQPRNFTKDKHKTVDDRPYGGGPGMVMKTEPLYNAITTAKSSMPENTKVIYVSPQGKTFNQNSATQLSKEKSLIFVAGRYEGIDDRLISTIIDEQWSIGDYVLTGGENAIMVMLDAIIRLIPNVLGDAESAKQDSFVNGLLDYPHYTRPENFHGLTVPKVLLCGDHKKITKWRLKQSLGRTWLHRPDLIEKLQLNTAQQKLLQEFIEENLSTCSTDDA